MSELSIDQPQAFTPADTFRRAAPGIAPLEPAVPVAMTEAFTASPAEAAGIVAEQTFAIESANIEAMTGTIEDQVEPAERTKLQRAGHVGKRAVEATLLSLALNPITNEGLRLLIAGTVQATTKNPALTAAAWGGSTLFIESGSALITSDLLASEKAPKTIAWLNNLLGKIGVKETTKFNPVVKAGISYIAGSGVAVAVEQREDPTRTRGRNIRYGLKNAAAVASVCTVQGALVATGIADPNPTTIGMAIIGVGSVFGVGKWAKGRISNATPEMVVTDESADNEIHEEMQ